ncbi:SPOR domain-containing protein [Taylorella equigenitalis]|nr:SPOR domain-containing protein [Taylorella equigenitalis]AFN35127.1 putative exported protein [Taylorella equigenitalis ATCC 35865]ASY38571.1 SPOR domain-containing protein [Taylorella equigenitalis]WDU56378.1 SPOR domain-containing protein [Taylorella equigenitalis]VEG32920.1 Uncharacterized protein conserved in bacteria [Taylorella equigenitalis ATCC 35865]
MARKKTIRVKKSRSSSSGFGWMIFGLALGLVFASLAMYFFSSKSLNTNTPKVASHKESSNKPTETIKPKPQTQSNSHQVKENIATESTKTENPPPPKAEQKPSNTQDKSDALGAMIALKEDAKPVAPVVTDASNTPSTATPTDTTAIPTVATAPATSTADTNKNEVSKEALPKAEGTVAPIETTTESEVQEPKFNKFLFAGKFLDRADAESFRANLIMNGLRGAKIVTTKVKGITYYKVRVGPFKSKSEYESAKQRISR